MYTTGDFLIKIKNAYMTGKRNVEYSHSNVVLAIAKILEKEGYVGKVSENKEKEGRKAINIELKYQGRLPAISEIKLVSRPSIHRYIGKANLRRAAASHGIGIVSTSHGIMTNKQAQKEGVGGELICQIY